LHSGSLKQSDPDLEDDLTRLQDRPGEAKGKGTARADDSRIRVKNDTWSSISERS